MTTTYIVQSGNLFKIGSTRNWKQRRSAIVRDYGPVSDVLVMHGEKSRERELQAAFMEYNINYRSNGRWRRCDWFKNIPFANAGAVPRSGSDVGTSPLLAGSVSESEA